MPEEVRAAVMFLTCFMTEESICFSSDSRERRLQLYHGRLFLNTHQCKLMNTFTFI